MLVKVARGLLGGLARARDLDWVYLSPAALLEPGERTGRYRVGSDRLLADDQGRSRITMEDFAIAMLDEIEEPKHSCERFTVAQAAAG